MQSIVMKSVHLCCVSFKQSVIYKRYIINVVMLSVIMLNVGRSAHESNLKKPVSKNALAYLSGVSVTRQNSFITLPAEGVHRSRSL
jgi:hypothetical protein